jgi:hypothetical protein
MEHKQNISLWFADRDREVRAIRGDRCIARAGGGIPSAASSRDRQTSDAVVRLGRARFRRGRHDRRVDRCRVDLHPERVEDVSHAVGIGEHAHRGRSHHRRVERHRCRLLRDDRVAEDAAVEIRDEEQVAVDRQGDVVRVAQERARVQRAVGLLTGAADRVANDRRRILGGRLGEDVRVLVGRGDAHRDHLSGHGGLDRHRARAGRAQEKSLRRVGDVKRRIPGDPAAHVRRSRRLGRRVDHRARRRGEDVL